MTIAWAWSISITKCKRSGSISHGFIWRFPAAIFLTGNYPNVLAASHDGLRLYVAEGGINAVAILDTSDPFAPKLLGRIPTGWWPVALAISPDDKFLYSVNAKGIGEDINPATTQADPPSATGVESFEDSNLVFGTVQKVLSTRSSRSKPESMTTTS